MEQWSTHNSHEVHNVHRLPNASTQSLISQIMEGQGRGNPRERNHFEVVWAGTETEQHPNSQRYPAYKYEFKYKQKQFFFCNGRWQERMKDEAGVNEIEQDKKGFVASAIHCIECQQWYSCLPTSSKSEISGRFWEILTLYKIDQNISEGENLQCDHWFIVRHILLKKAMNEWEPCKIGPDCCQWHRSPELGVNLIWRFTLWLL